MSGLYNYRWQKRRAAFLAEHPLCARCEERGLVVEATTVDHVIPHRGDERLFWDEANWQSLCTTCHASHKQALERSGKVEGCDVNGLPLDPAHPWKME